MPFMHTIQLSDLEYLWLRERALSEAEVEIARHLQERRLAQKFPALKLASLYVTQLRAMISLKLLSQGATGDRSTRRERR